MILAIDMGNTQIEIGVLRNDDILMSERLSTDQGRTETEYAVLLHTIFELRGIDPKEISGAIISSVVPPLTGIIRRAVKKVTGVDAFLVGPGLKTGLKLMIDDPRTLGADIVVDSVAVSALYGYPAVVIDMGTATTVTYLDREGHYRGGAIIPGLIAATEALISRTSQLPKISFDKPPAAIGRNTVDALKSGALFGQAAMLDGMIERFREEMGEPEAKVVATGGLSDVVVPYCKHPVILDRELMLKGLKLIYEKNRT